MEQHRQGNSLESFPLYSEQCADYLRLALTKAESETQEDDFRKFYEPTAEERGWSSSEEGKGSSSSSEDEGESSSDEQQQQAVKPDGGAAAQKKQISPKAARGLNLKQKDATKRQLGRPPCTALGLPDTDHVLELPAALLSKDERLSNQVIICKSYRETATALSKQPTLLLLLRSGRFAGAIFSGPKCLQHTTSTRYTIRKGQGKAQSAQDGKRKPKSVGSQLRRQGEEALREDVKSFLRNNQQHVKTAGLILLSCPKTMMKAFFDDNQDLVPRGDKRLKKIPLDVGRPTFEAAVAVYEIMMQAHICESRPVVPIDQVEVVNELPTVVEKSEETKPVEKQKEIVPLTPLHEHAAAGNVSELLEFLEQNPDCNVNQQAGEDYMTPLHFAACESSDDPVTSAACVTALLIQGGANPCTLDARRRPPYFLASQEKVREAFRMARDTLGEDYCQWDDAAKVGPPMTMDDVQKKKEKAAEKKKRQKARQKEKKAKERAMSEEAEKQRTDEEERVKQVEEAKRIRDGLAPKATTATNVCDFCQKRCRNKRRSQMLQRLDYAYCSTACVQNHKRELMAAAAAARFGG